MKTSTQSKKTVLALDPTSRGFGFVILQGPETLIEWGTRISDSEKDVAPLKRAAQLIDSCSPDVIVVEDCGDEDCRRSPRVRLLIEDILRLAVERDIKVCSFPRRRILAVLSQSGTGEKHQIATNIANQFPELLPRLPRVRKPWMSEDYRMAIFDAMALALTFFSES